MTTTTLPGARRSAPPAVTVISAENTFSPPVRIHGGFNFSLSGAWVATVVLQRSFDGGGAWHDVASYTAPIEDSGVEVEQGVLYRWGVKTGAYTSGTVVGRL